MAEKPGKTPAPERRDAPTDAPRDGPGEAPHHTPRTREDKAARQARLAAEMRRNLLRRKRQQRARDGRKPADD